MKTFERNGSSSGRTLNILSISPNGDDHDSLQEIFSHTEQVSPVASRWRLHRSATFPEAWRTLRRMHISLILCERDLPAGKWSDLLTVLTGSSAAPHIIVTSRLADDRLWAEALNLGAYDVLAKPFRSDEVLRVIRSAENHWWDLHGTPPPHEKAIRSVA